MNKYFESFVTLCLLSIAVFVMGIVVAILSVYYLLEMIIDKFINWLENE